MSHDPEAAEAPAPVQAERAIATALWRRRGRDVNALDGPAVADYSDAIAVLDALAAAGYTVTKARYVQPHPKVLGPAGAMGPYWRTSDGSGHPVMLHPFDVRDDDEPLYRKIEGSIDGADRD